MDAVGYASVHFRMSLSKGATEVLNRGVQILRFEAVNAGQTALKLAYRRSWEKDVEPLETYSIQVVVR